MSNISIPSSPNPETRFFARNAILISYDAFEQVMREITQDNTIRLERDYPVLSCINENDRVFEESEIVGILEHYLGRRITTAFKVDEGIYFILTEEPRNELVIPASSMKNRINNLIDHHIYKTKELQAVCQGTIRRINEGGSLALIKRTPRDMQDIQRLYAEQEEADKQIKMLEHILASDAVPATGLTIPEDMTIKEAEEHVY